MINNSNESSLESRESGITTSSVCAPAVFRGFGSPFLFLLMLAIFLPGCSSDKAVKLQNRPGKHLVEIQGQKVWCLVADDASSRARGLMYRKNMPEDEGMLFLFPAAISQGFWMKNCMMDLDIAYIDDDGIIVDVLTMKAPEPGAVLYPRYRSSQPVRYVLETNAGWFEKHGIIAGESVQGFRGPAGSNPR